MVIDPEDPVEQVMLHIRAEREAINTLQRRVLGSLSMMKRSDPEGDIQIWATNFLENLDWRLPDDLSDLGEHAQAFSTYVSRGQASVLASATALFHSYTSCSDHLRHMVLSRWRIKGRPRRTVDTLIRLQSRSQLAGKEVFALLSAGFPEGAIARTRSIYEYACVARALASNSVVLTERYDVSHMFELARRLRAGEMKYTRVEDRASLDRRTAELERKFGSEMWRPYGWAEPVLGKGASLFDLVKEYGSPLALENYGSASHYVHAVQVGIVKAELADPSGVYGTGPRPNEFYRVAYECVEAMHELNVELVNATVKSAKTNEALLWLRLLGYIRKETQLEITHAQMFVDPQWAALTSAKVAAAFAGLDD